MDNKETIISIVTPSYNQDKYISAAIDSVLSQAGDFYIDYILVDGNSSDKSAEIILETNKKISENTDFKLHQNIKFYKSARYKNKGISFRYIIEQDSGHGNALNKGFKLAVGSIIAWINSDDFYYPEAFSTVVEVFNKFEKVKWITGKNTWIDKNGKTTGSKMIYKNLMDFITYDYEWIQQESVFWRRSLWESAGSKIDESKKYMIDGELWSRFFIRANLYHVEKALGAFRRTGQNRSLLNSRELASEMREICSSLKTEIKKDLKYEFDYPLIKKENNNWVIVSIENDKSGYALNYKNTLEYRLGFLFLHPVKSLKIFLEKVFKI
jgi:glycosyltransferase involved in cell wall biosynthesis